jgi:hypothetical protein
MNYGDLIKDAFRISWRNKYLWFFGFFAGGAGGFFNVPPVPSGGGGDFDDFDPGGSDFSSSLAARAGQGVFENVGLLIALGVVVLLIVLVFIALGLISQGALAESVAAIDRGEQRRFSSSWRAGFSNLWRVLGYYVLFILISLGFLLVIGIPLALLVGGTFFATESVGARVSVAVLAALVGIGLLILIFIPLAIIGQFALRELVVRRERVVSSIGGGYRLFRRNLGRSLLVWIIQVAVMLGAGIALIIAVLLLGLVLFLPIIFLAVAGYTTAAIVMGVIAGLILLPLLLVASGALGTFNHSYWTLAYLRLTRAAERQVA